MYHHLSYIKYTLSLEILPPPFFSSFERAPFLLFPHMNDRKSNVYELQKWRWGYFFFFLFLLPCFFILLPPLYVSPRLQDCICYVKVYQFNIFTNRSSTHELSLDWHKSCRSQSRPCMTFTFIKT